MLIGHEQRLSSMDLDCLNYTAHFELEVRSEFLINNELNWPTRNRAEACNLRLDLITAEWHIRELIISRVVGSGGTGKSRVNMRGSDFCSPQRCSTCVSHGAQNSPTGKLGVG